MFVLDGLHLLSVSAQMLLEWFYVIKRTRARGHSEFSLSFIFRNVMNLSAGILFREEHCPLMYIHIKVHIRGFWKHGGCHAAKQYVKSP